MKKRLAVLVTAAVVAAGLLAGCGGSAAPASSAAKSSVAASSAAASSAAPASSAAASSAAASSAAGSQASVIEVPVVFENKCGVDLKELYLSGAGRDEWGTDALGGQGLKSGESAKGALVIDAENVKWDIKAVDGNGDSVEFQGLDLSECSTSGVTMTLAFDGEDFVVTAK
ncbi:MAG: hypothetical protein IK152_10135 [Lachnospiraceae bacterium]|nr:hypothetical protein [Lachnospiraceae bacterium]